MIDIIEKEFLITLLETQQVSPLTESVITSHLKLWDRLERLEEVLTNDKLQKV